MKKSDWALVVLIVAIAGLISYFIANALLPAPNKDPQTVPTATVISSDVVQPSDQIFNANAINPTVQVTIGNQNPSSPFTPGSQ